VKLLLLEDDEATRAQLTKVMIAAGNVVDACATGPDAIFLGSSNDYDVLILDRMVPVMDGLTVLRALRAADIKAPAIFLAAMDGVHDRVEGLNAGADDYLSSRSPRSNCWRGSTPSRGGHAHPTWSRRLVSATSKSIWSGSRSNAEVAGAGVQAARIPHASCRRAGHTHHAARL